MKKENTRQDVFSIITDRIIQLLEAGIVPWHSPWTEAGIPRNLITGIPFKDENLLHLSALGFPVNLFITFKQLKEFGGEARPNEKPYPIAYWKWPEGQEVPQGAENKVRPVLRYYSVYNISQCKGIPKEVLTNSNSFSERVLTCEETIAMMPKRPEIRSVEKEAYYNPKEDYINMPPQELYRDASGYYSDLFCQLVHATGHETRLSRKEIEHLPHDLGTYSAEKLIAEIGSFFLQGYANIKDNGVEVRAAYLKGWVSAINEDTRMIVFASRQAQKAVDYILSGQDEHEPETVADGHPTFVSH